MIDPAQVGCADGDRCVVVVGAGASGTLVTSHLITSLGSRFRVELIDPAPDAVGPAYATSDERHLLNVPASGMSALPRDPEHFLRWLRRHHRDTFQPHEFAPRSVYGRYLKDLLSSAASFPSSAHLTQHRDLVSDVVPHPTGFDVRLAGGGSIAARAVVLATGAVPSDRWAPRDLATSPAFVLDPWSQDDLASLADGDGDLLLVGSGLTMVDLAISLDRPGRTLHVVSRTDTLPRRHVVPTVPPVPPPPGITRLFGLNQVERAIVEHVDRTVAATGDWRAAVDGLRPVTQLLWANLPEGDKEAFTRSAARIWDTHRHRMSPPTAARFDALVKAGRLVRHRGSLAAVRPAANGLTLTLTDGTEVGVRAVLNCTGPSATIEANPLLRRLAEVGTVTAGPVGLGIDTTAEGRALGRDMGPASAQNLFALGTLRKGNLWESTAIPEIREQAWDVARAVARAMTRTATGRPEKRRTDRYGLTLSTGSVAAGWYDRALTRLLRLQDGVDEALAEAVDVDPTFAHAHSARALLAHELGTEGDSGATSLRAAHAAAARTDLDDREVSFLDAVTLRLRGDEAGGAAALLRHIKIFPRDALAVSVAVPTVAFGGLTAGTQTHELVEWLGRAYGDDPW